MSKLETDRDLLIEVISNVKNLCQKFETFKVDNKEEHNIIFKLLNEQANNKVSNKLFYFIMAIVIASILSLTAYTGIIKNDVVKNTVNIENLSK